MENRQYAVVGSELYYSDTNSIKDLKRVKRGWNEIDYFWFIETPGVLHVDGQDIEISEPAMVIKTYPVRDYSKKESESIVIPAKYIVISSAELISTVNEINKAKEELENRLSPCKGCDCCACESVG